MLTSFRALSPQWRASIMMFVALFFFTVMGVCIRLASHHVPVMEIVFFRNFLGVILLLPLFMRTGFKSLKMNRPKLFFGRAATNFVGMYCGFAAVTMIPLAEATVLTFTTPIFITIGAVMFLGEIIRLRRVIAIIIGFIGTLIILQPGVATVSTGALLALTGAFAIAMASLFVKKLTQTESPESIVFWMVALQMPIGFFPMLAVWQDPGLEGWLWLGAVAVSGTVAHLQLTRAYSLVEITSLQPLEFTKLIFAVILAWFIFGEWPTIWIWVGGLVIFASTAYITHREAKASRSVKPNHGLKEPKL